MQDKKRKQNGSNIKIENAVRSICSQTQGNSRTQDPTEN